MRMTISEDLSRKMALASFLCALLVVAIHVPAVDHAPSRLVAFVKQIFSNGICRIAVPYFFVASGFFLGRSSLKDNWYVPAIRKRCSSLFAPYIIWSFMWMLFTYVMLSLSSAVHSCREFELPALPSLISVLGLDFSALPNMYVLWFVRALIIMIVISPLIVFLVKPKILGCITLALFFAYLLFSENIPCPILKGIFPPQGVAYFSAGVFFSFHAVKDLRNKPIDVAIFILGVIVLAGNVVYSFGLWLRQIGVIICLAGCWRLLPSRTLPPIFCRMAFPIYLLHLFVLMPSAILIHAITGSYSFDESLFGYVTYWFIGIAGSLVVGKLMLKAMFVARICFGGR